MFFLHCMLNILRYEKIFLRVNKLTSRLLHSKIHQVLWFFLAFTANTFSFLYSIFFSKNCVLWSSCLLVGTELIILDTSGKPIVGFFLKITSLSWKVLSISLDVFNSVDWLLKSWWWIFLKWFSFYFCKKSLIWQKILQIFREFILILSFEYYREC